MNWTTIQKSQGDYAIRRLVYCPVGQRLVVGYPKSTVYFGPGSRLSWIAQRNHGFRWIVDGVGTANGRTTVCGELHTVSFSLFLIVSFLCHGFDDMIYSRICDSSISWLNKWCHTNLVQPTVSNQESCFYSSSDHSCHQRLWRMFPW